MKSPLVLVENILVPGARGGKNKMPIPPGGPRKAGTGEKRPTHPEAPRKSPPERGQPQRFPGPGARRPPSRSLDEIILAYLQEAEAKVPPRFAGGEEDPTPIANIPQPGYRRALANAGGTPLVGEKEVPAEKPKDTLPPGDTAEFEFFLGSEEESQTPQPKPTSSTSSILKLEEGEEFEVLFGDERTPTTSPEGTLEWELDGTPVTITVTPAGVSTPAPAEPATPPTVEQLVQEMSQDNPVSRPAEIGRIIAKTIELGQVPLDPILAEIRAAGATHMVLYEELGGTAHSSQTYPIYMVIKNVSTKETRQVSLGRGQVSEISPALIADLASQIAELKTLKTALGLFDLPPENIACRANLISEEDSQALALCISALKSLALQLSLVEMDKAKLLDMVFSLNPVSSAADKLTLLLNAIRCQKREKGDAGIKPAIAGAIKLLKKAGETARIRCQEESAAGEAIPVCAVLTPLDTSQPAEKIPLGQKLKQV